MRTFLRCQWPETLAVLAAFVIASVWFIWLLAAGLVFAQEPQILEPPPFFHHPVVAPGKSDPYRGKCKRPDGADCCGGQHCVSVPGDDLGRLQLTPGGPFVDPYSLMPRPSICNSAVLPPLYDALDHICEGPTQGMISCVFMRGGTS